MKSNPLPRLFLHANASTTTRAASRSFHWDLAHSEMSAGSSTQTTANGRCSSGATTLGASKALPGVGVGVGVETGSEVGVGAREEAEAGKGGEAGAGVVDLE